MVQRHMFLVRSVLGASVTGHVLSNVWAFPVSTFGPAGALLLHASTPHSSGRAVGSRIGDSCHCYASSWVIASKYGYTEAAHMLLGATGARATR